MKRLNILVVLSFIATLYSPLVAAEIGEKELKMFYPSFADRANGIAIVVNGQYFNREIDMLNMPDDAVGEIKDISNLIVKHVAANKGGVIENMLENWAERDQDRIKNLFSDKAVLNQNKERFEALEKMELVMAFKYMGNLILIIDHAFGDSRFTFHIELTKVADRYFLTNQLPDDFALGGMVNLLYGMEAKNLAKQ